MKWIENQSLYDYTDDVEDKDRIVSIMECEKCKCSAEFRQRPHEDDSSYEDEDEDE